MKRLEDILGWIRSLPEEGRKILAGVLFAASVLLVFAVWSAAVSRGLERSQFAEFGEPAAEVEEEKTAAYGPLAGILESVRSIKNLVSEPSGETGNSFRQAAGGAKTLAQRALNSLANILYGY